MSSGATILLAIILPSKFIAVILGSVFSQVIIMLVFFLLEKDMWFPIPKVSCSAVRAVLKYGIPFVPVFAITWIFQSMDRLTLRAYSDFNEIGLYSAAFKVVSIMNLVQVGFSTFWVPTAYEHYEKYPEDKEFYSKMAELVSAVMFLLAIMVIGFKNAIFLILARAYRQAAYISPFLVFIPTMFSISEVTQVGINFKKKPHYHIIISLAAAITNFFGNIWLVPILGARGAAISTGISYVVFFLARTLFSVRLYPVDYKVLKMLFGVLTLIIVALVNTLFEKVVIGAVVAFVGFVIVLLLYRKTLRYFW